MANENVWSKKTEADLDFELKKLYQLWLRELDEKCSEFLYEDQYSNPYFTCVPSGWCKNDIRIMIVGEEGFGNWGRGKADGIRFDMIHEIQSFCWESLVSYLDYNKDSMIYSIDGTWKKINSPFWRRAKKINKYGICAWNNLDKFHLRQDKKCGLGVARRKKLCLIETHLLEEEIRILNPTHVVLFGWYGISLEHELPELFKELYPNGLGHDEVWKNNVVYRELDGRHYIAAYHPNWGVRHKGYEDHVMEIFRSTL